MKCEFGFCSVCDKEIASGTPKRPTNDYTEVEMTWSQGAKMNVAVCTDCARSHAWATPEAKEGITQAHWDRWDKEHGIYSKEIVLV